MTKDMFLTEELKKLFALVCVDVENAEVAYNISKGLDNYNGELFPQYVYNRKKTDFDLYVAELEPRLTEIYMAVRGKISEHFQSGLEYYKSEIINHVKKTMDVDIQITSEPYYHTTFSAHETCSNRLSIRRTYSGGNKKYVARLTYNPLVQKKLNKFDLVGKETSHSENSYYGLVPTEDIYTDVCVAKLVMEYFQENDLYADWCAKNQERTDYVYGFYTFIREILKNFGDNKNKIVNNAARYHINKIRTTVGYECTIEGLGRHKANIDVYDVRKNKKGEIILAADVDWGLTKEWGRVKRKKAKKYFSRITPDSLYEKWLDIMSN